MSEKIEMAGISKVGEDEGSVSGKSGRQSEKVESTSDSDTSPVKRATNWVKSNPNIVIIGTVAIFLFLIFIMVIVFSGEKKPDPIPKKPVTSPQPQAPDQSFSEPEPEPDSDSEPKSSPSFTENEPGSGPTTKKGGKS